MTTVIGIDPGAATGGIAIAVNETLVVLPMPDIRNFFCEMKIHALIGDAHVFVEKAQSFPKQGIASAFNYGRHFGELLGVLVSCGLRHTLVPPAVWSKTVHAGTKGGDTKVRTLEAVRRLFPDTNFKATQRCKKPHSGMVDAAAIAWYGQQYLKRGTTL